MSGSGRRVLAGLFWLLASLGIMVSTVVVWAHQTLLTTDGWTRLVADVAEDPEVIEGTSDIIVTRVGEAIGLQDRVAQVMPGEMDLLAGVITQRVEEAASDVVTRALSNEKVQQALATINGAAHTAAMTAIRGGGEALDSEAGVITLNVLPLVEQALLALQDAGFIDPDRQIPDLSEYEPPAETVARLETILGRPLPDDLGTIQLVDSQRLANAQQAVRTFDLLTIGALVVTILLAIAAVALANRRLRMVVWLGIGGAIALLLGRAITRLIVEDLAGSLADGPNGDTIRAVVEASVDGVMWFSFVVIVIALLVAGVALWFERRSAAPEAQPTSVSAWLRDNRRSIGLAGLGVIGFLVLWRVGGPDIALLAAAAVGIWLIGTNILAGGAPDAEAPAEVRAGG